MGPGMPWTRGPGLGRLLSLGPLLTGLGTGGIPRVIGTSGLRMKSIQVFKLQLNFYFKPLGLRWAHDFAPIHRAKGFLLKMSLLDSPGWGIMGENCIKLVWISLSTFHHAVW